MILTPLSMNIRGNFQLFDSVPQIIIELLFWKHLTVRKFSAISSKVVEYTTSFLTLKDCSVQNSLSSENIILSTLFLPWRLINFLHHCNLFILCVKPWTFLLTWGRNPRSSFRISCIVLRLTFTSVAILFAERWGFLRIFSGILFRSSFERSEIGQGGWFQFLQLLVSNYRFIILYINTLLSSKLYNS